MANSEDEIYSTMFSSLKHPARRKILRMLSERSMSFSQMLEEIEVSSSHLTYHLETLGELVSKLDSGQYKLSTFGEAAVSTMKRVEEAPADKAKQLSRLPLRWKSLFALFAIALVLLSSFSALQYASLNQMAKDNETLVATLNDVNAENQQLLSWGSGTDKAITFIRDVMQIDMTKYRASLLSDTIQYRADLGGVLEEVLKYSLTSSQSKIDVVLRFRDNHFSRYQLYLDEGSPIYSQPQPADRLSYTRALLERYQNYVNESYLNDMKSLMATVDETNANSSILNHTKVQVTGSNETGELLLMYSDQEIDFSAKSLRFVFQNRLLTELTDGWFLLTIGSTQVNISEQQARQIAIDYVENYSWTVNGTEVSNLKVVEAGISTMFVPHPKDASLALVPYWYILLPLDHLYPGNVNAISIGVWGDNGEITNVQTLNL
ncbi:MAG: winged helix-turn-helix domain-containing protein [Candidatus Bathyarchaeota archaeon]|nr:winged helix-turn-helix domain-containing protein [Candidatus Bathyarchaeota archaeon]